MSTVEARLRLWQLLSPALPIGAYAYSRGLEYAVAAGWVCDEAGAAEWIGGQLRHTVQGLDIPVLDVKTPRNLAPRVDEGPEKSPIPGGLACLTTHWFITTLRKKGL